MTYLICYTTNIEIAATIPQAYVYITFAATNTKSENTTSTLVFYAYNAMKSYE